MPTMLHTCDAAALSLRRIIGPRSARSARVRRRCRTPGRRRYATSSIGLSTLADGTVRPTSTPRSPCSVRTPNEMPPARVAAYDLACLMCGVHAAHTTVSNTT